MPTKKLFSLLFILLLLCSTAAAESMTEEDIWIYQGAYELGINDRAYLEGFTLKVYDIDSVNGSSATLLIYRNGIFKESFSADSQFNNEYIYNKELKIETLQITRDQISLQIYKKKTELVWVTDIPKTSFKVGDTLTGNDYKISLLDINDEGALIAVDYQSEENEDIYNTGDYRKFSEDFMIDVVYIKRDTQEVFIETLKPGAPGIKLDVADLKSSYEPDEYVEYELIVTNNGTIPLHGIIVNTESSDAKVETQVQQYSILDPGKATKFTVKANPSAEPMGKNIEITSKVQGYDYRGNEYHSEIVATANIKPYLSIEKQVYSKDKTSENPEFGTEQYFRILINIENKADFLMAATVTDSLPDSFIPDEIENTEWAIAIESGQTQTIEYFASPTEPGNFTFGPASVTWNDNGKTYTLETAEINQSFHVSGSKLAVTKKLSSSYMLLGEENTVNLRISNEGDRDVEISFQEELPEELSFVNGVNSWNGELEAGQSMDFNYNVKAEETGELYLPAAEISFVDENGRKQSVESDEEFLYIDQPAGQDNTSYSGTDTTGNTQADVYDSTMQNQMTGVETAGFLTSSFILLFCLIGIVPSFAYLYIIRIYK